ncbi:hypothetical protein PV396_43505 [Streptomyces sp. ME02-8801-2C]|uniref:hypothetical protein n=1 Tax=Streptomyces sp. ME02-8801-2C TaxID=3028680 RepID=UPI0029A8A84D|nr:hypothetical protein [Streptomyces sp. ME02-8801-2C]MDX3458718.1 hypothetical protein [Streptomyces sp. ME02-8801-2C]
MGNRAVRLVLLVLLLFGVGVLHTLSHAGAHGAVAAPHAVQHSAHTTYVTHAAAPALAGAAHSPAVAEAVEREQPDAHRLGEPAGDVEAASCFALVPTGSWLVPPDNPAAWSGEAYIGVMSVGRTPDSCRGAASTRSPLLRI